MEPQILLFSITEFFGISTAQAVMIVFNLILIESMLSVDNALVMGTMVMDLPKKERGRALRWGIFGAYFFRGLALLLASILMQVAWLKALGGLYLLYLAYGYFFKKHSTEEEKINKEKNWFYRVTVGKIGKFWSTVILVNIMDLAFSIDNVFAAVAYTEKVKNGIYLVYLGVFIGILAIRFVAQGVIKLLEKFPFLTSSAFLIIAVLGVKLVLSFAAHEFNLGKFGVWIDSEHTDLIVSILTVAIFIVPVLTSWLFNFPKKIYTVEEKELIEWDKRMDEEGEEKTDLDENPGEENNVK